VGCLLGWEEGETLGVAVANAVSDVVGAADGATTGIAVEDTETGDKDGKEVPISEVGVIVEDDCEEGACVSAMDGDIVDAFTEGLAEGLELAPVVGDKVGACEGEAAGTFVTGFALIVGK
jgi:hypothetical protein